MTIGLKFDNSYAHLPEHFYTRIHPTPVPAPELVIMNHDLASALGLMPGNMSDDQLTALFSGNALPDDAEPIAQAYAGHQFGHFTQLGDGRAHLIGEHITPDGSRVDIQLKGSGQTPYARRGDGRAALGPMLREYIISEAMHALNIPTTRSLAVVTTGESAYRETALTGAILTRIATSHIRVGTFEYFSVRQDVNGLKTLADYTIHRHYPHLEKSDQPYLDLIQTVMERQIALIVNWLRVGFIHGVMNTDNTTISGETIDYGPCAFMDAYAPDTVFSSIDHMGRYAYANQPTIIGWNLARLAEALLPLLHDDIKQAITLAEKAIHPFHGLMQKAWLDMMCSKLGLLEAKKEDETLIGDLLQWMQRHHMDYTNTFRALTSEQKPDGEAFETEEFQKWWQNWQERLGHSKKPLSDALDVMRANNPAIIPRNHKVEDALSAAETQGNFTKLHRLLQAIADPYSDHPDDEAFRAPPKPEERVYQTFCGT